MDEASRLAEGIVDQIADAVIFADSAGTIVRWNRASTALFGYSAEEALRQSIDLIIPEHLRAAHWRGFDAAMAKGTTTLSGRPILTRALHKSGRRLYVEMSFAIVKGHTENEVLGAVAVARDVTERVERERAASRSR
ncbi:MAG: PAS domain S-box protein [Xanthobacteraceae bacterium]